METNSDIQYRAEADARLKFEESRGRLQLDGAPPGYTICLQHGNAVRVFNAEGKWIEAGGVCEFCWKEIHSRRKDTSRQGLEVDPPAEAALQTGVDGSNRGQAPAVGDVQELQIENGVDGQPGGRDEVRTHPGRSDGGKSGSDYWDDVFGFPVSLLKNK